MRKKEIDDGPLMRSQFYDDRIAYHRTGADRLAFEVMINALRAYATPGKSHDEAAAWFANDDLKSFSFVRVCEALGYDPGWFRKMLAHTEPRTLLKALGHNHRGKGRLHKVTTVARYRARAEY